MVNYFTTLFLGKPPKGSLPVFSAHFSPLIDNLLFLNHQKTEVFFQEKMCWMQGSISGPPIANWTFYGQSYRGRCTIFRFKVKF